MLYYADTMQAKAMKLMASKLAVAGIIEGTFSEEGLAAMSDVKDLTSQMAKELALGIRDNVEDIAAAFRKMAVMNPERKKNITAAQPKETAAEEIKEQKKYDLYRSFFFRDVVQVNNADEIITDKLALCSGSICCL